MEVFIGDLFVYSTSFWHCSHNLHKVLQRCEQMNLVLNRKKCHFIIQERVVLSHAISNKGIEVDKVKMEIMEKVPPPNSIKGVMSFLRHAGFYQQFMKFLQNYKTLYPIACQTCTF